MADSRADAPRASPGGADIASLEEEFQGLVQVAERYRADLGALEEQRSLFANVVEDYRRARKALEALGTAKRGDEILLPLGAGSFVRANLEDPGRILSGIGSRLHVETDVADALARVEDRAKQTEAALARLDAETNRLVDELRAVNARLQSIAAQGGA